MRLNFKFMQTDGVPLTADLMDQMQEAYAIFNVMGNLSGNLTILSGCEIVGSAVAPGIVVINNDVLYFEGGTVSSTVYIHQEDIQKVFKNQVSKVLIEKKTVRFGSASTNYNWSDFIRLKTLREIQILVENSVSQQQFALALADIDLLKLKTAPIVNGGVILSFRKPANEIPLGWKECTDTTGKMLIHCDPNDVELSTLGNPVGNKKITQTIAQMPVHSFTYTRTLPWSAGSGGGFGGGGNQFNISGQNTNTIGNGEAMNILNPARIVLFIEPNFQ